MYKNVDFSNEHLLLPEYTPSPFYLIALRVIDIIVSICALIIFSPALILVSLAILIEDKHNPFYVDMSRLGKDKKRIKFYKFRSMIVNASEMERKNKEIYKQIRSGVHKIENHPYVTKVGRFIRKYSIDEMPQFLNVLSGEMSVVGARALKHDEVEKFLKEEPSYAKYMNALFEFKPGITGIWQVSGRSKIDFKTRLRMEAYYNRKRNLLTDILVMLKTPLAVLKAETH